MTPLARFPRSKPPVSPATGTSRSTPLPWATQRQWAKEKLDQEALREVAAATNGGFFLAMNHDELVGIYDQLDQIETRDIKTVTHRPRPRPVPLAGGCRAGPVASGTTRKSRFATGVCPNVKIPRATEGQRSHLRVGDHLTMNGLGDFHFIRPLWLLLLPAVVGLWWIAISTSDALRGWRLIMDAELLAAMTVGRDRPQRIQHILPLVGWILAVIAIAGPTWRPEPSPFADDPAPVMILLRAGESMNRTDLAPSRMERARLKVADFAKLRKGQPMGLIAYAGSAHLVLPPTRDTSIVADMAAEISPDLMPAPGRQS